METVVEMALSVEETALAVVEMALSVEETALSVEETALSVVEMFPYLYKIENGSHSHGIQHFPKVLAEAYSPQSDVPQLGKSD